MPVYPISFSIPEEKIVKEVPDKTKQFADIIPGNVSTYRFNDEESYYEDYRKSMFGYTWKKGGWDCLRHYEILANGCIPWFNGLEQCPPNTMVHFPKQLVLEAMRSDSPKDTIHELLEYTKNTLTCRAMAQYVLDTIGHPSPNRILYISDDSRPDYLRCLTLIGFKQILGSRCHDVLCIPHIYDDATEVTSLYGKGFTYSRVIPSSAKADTSFSIRDAIANHEFDVVIYGSCHRGRTWWNEVHAAYSPQDIVLMCGEDTCDATICPAQIHIDHQGFVREL